MSYAGLAEAELACGDVQAGFVAVANADECVTNVLAFIRETNGQV